MIKLMQEKLEVHYTAYSISSSKEWVHKYIQPEHLQDYISIATTSPALSLPYGELKNTAEHRMTWKKQTAIPCENKL